MKFSVTIRPRSVLHPPRRGGALVCAFLVVVGAGASFIAGCDSAAPASKPPPGARMGSPEEEAAKLATVQKAFEERQKMRAERERKGQAKGQKTPPPPASPK